MYYFKPCIGARAGGVPEVIDEGKTGLLVEPEDVKGLANALVRLLNDEALRQKMGQAGRERLEHEFSFERFRERLEKLLCMQ
jgi:glycosyltransferase involved in cell wall biosynthesis